MTTVQLKAEIHKAVDELPEDRLSDIWKYITSVQYQSPETSDLDEFIDKVFKEDDGLLRRLAQ